FYWWLNTVELLSDNSPVLIVKNEKDERFLQLDEGALRGRFTNLKEVLSANLASNRGLNQILDTIRCHVSHLPHVGTALPKFWVKVRAALENDPRNHITLDKYLDICKQQGFRRREDMLQLSEYLHDLGVCLHFQNNDLLMKTVILKPEWGTTAVYKVLDNNEVKRSFGRFSRADLAIIWHEDEYAEMRGELLRLMMNFKLCYELEESGQYIAPQLLSKQRPNYDWDARDNLLLRYSYQFMPKGILTRFIVAMHFCIAEQRQCVWKSGVVLERDDTRAEIIEDYDRREIQIRVAGRHKRDLLTVILHELDRIHDSFRAAARLTRMTRNILNSRYCRMLSPRE
ncbi:MAG TPA: COR domain-containing protein, partial [Saprospiraceae bacterium]|nr:COR domain-containing protein [Saprospiraceae bacterium]